MNKFTLLILLAGLFPAFAIEIPEADGSDGVLNPSVNLQIDTRLAATTNWYLASPASGDGIYDPVKRVVVYKYTSVNIPTNVTMSFIANETSAPIVWLVDGDVTINGTLNLSASGSTAGAGGFVARPVNRNTMVGGSGYGGGTGIEVEARHHEESSSGSLGDARAYGNATLIPLYGGSNGGARSFSGSPGGGGGAILIAATGSITLEGSITAKGVGSGGFSDKVPGSGGAVRLVSEKLSGSGTIDVRGTNVSGKGRIRLEAKTDISFFDVYFSTAGPRVSKAVADDRPVTVQPDTFPSCTILSVDSAQAPTDPLASLTTPDIQVPTSTNVTVEIEVRNAEPTTSTVELRICPGPSAVQFFPAIFVSGDINQSLWEVQFAFPSGVSRLQAQLSTR